MAKSGRPRRSGRGASPVQTTGKPQAAPSADMRFSKGVRSCSSGSPAVSCARLPATAAAKLRRASWMGVVWLAASLRIWEAKASCRLWGNVRSAYLQMPSDGR